MLSSLPKNSKVSIAWLSDSVIEGALMSCPPWGRNKEGEGKEERKGRGGEGG